MTVDASTKISGYIFQFQRALYRLFSSEASQTTVGIETDDDVVEIKLSADGSVEIIFEQDKHSVQDVGHPYQDSSKNLWHSIHIWLDSLKTMRSKYEKISYCLVTNRAVTDRAFAKKLSAASTKAEIDDCVDDIRRRANEAKEGAGKSIKAVASFSDDDLYFVIENLKLMDEFATSSGNAAKDATIQLFQLPPDLTDKAEGIYSALIGLLVDTCHETWLKKKQVWIDKSSFTKRLHQEISSLQTAKHLEQPLTKTAYEEYLNGHRGEHIFLLQLKHLGAPEKMCKLALSHYWGFYAERVRLQTEGDVLPSAWDGRNDQLYQRWQMTANNCQLAARVGASDDELARAIVAETLNGSYTAKLGLHDTSNPYFTSGNYHDLANQPEHEFFVQWHPSFNPKKDDGE